MPATDKRAPVARRARPLSPHIFIYRMRRYSLLSSITNRITGLALSLGLIVLAYWLVGVAGGPVRYAQALGVLASWPLRIVYALLLGAFAYHLIAGIRHLIWDSGRALERAHSQRSAWLIGALAVALALVLWLWAFLGHRSIGS
jgi:succinate dehydrogenase / fumarate reductase cytochrome b subunit